MRDDCKLGKRPEFLPQWYLMMAPDARMRAAEVAKLFGYGSLTAFSAAVKSVEGFPKAVGMLAPMGSYNRQRSVAGYRKKDIQDYINTL